MNSKSQAGEEPKFLLPDSERFLQAAIDAITSHVALLDPDGQIIAVNKSWLDFAAENGGDPIATGVGTNYLTVCNFSEKAGAYGAAGICQGIRDVIDGISKEFSQEYPHHSAVKERWFNVRVTPLTAVPPTYVVITHENITLRRNAQQEVLELITSARCLLWQATVREDSGVLRWNLEIPHAEAAHKFLPISIPEGRDFSWAFYVAKDPSQLAIADETAAYAIRSGKERYHQEFSLRLASGALLWLYEDVEIESRGVGQWALTGVCTDITEQKRVQGEIARIMTSARCLLWQADVEAKGDGFAWRIHFSNLDAAKRFLPINIPEGGSFEEGFFLAKVPEEQAISNELSGAALRSGSDGYRQEYRVTLSPGEVRWLYEDVTIDAFGGGKWRLTGVCTDITERKRAEQALQDSELQFVNAFDHATTGTALVGLDGNWLKVNASLQELFGYSSEELVSMTFMDLTFPEDVALDVANMKLLLAGKIESMRREKRYLHKSGRIIHAITGVTLIRDLAGKPIQFITQVQDISEIKAAQAALLRANDELESRVSERTDELVVLNLEMDGARKEAEFANHAKSDFLSRMSHELRTPLNAVLGFGQILERQKLSELQAESVGHILNAGRHLLGLINEVLDFAKIDAGHMELCLKPVDLNNAVAEVCALLRPLADGRGIKIENHVSDSCGPTVEADPQRIRQVLINLIANAIKYNKIDGFVEISCSKSIKGFTRISVRDSGPGISDTERTKLFTAFERLDASRSEVEGNGLGLALSKQLVLAMGGQIGVDSAPGEGCTFWFDLKSSKKSVKRKVTNARNLGVSKVVFPEAGKHTILCIEDNVANLNLLEAVFQDRPDLKMLAALQGGVGLDLARIHRPSLILLELNLPDIPGSEVLARLRRHPVTRDIPIIVTSTYASRQQLERLMEDGAHAFVTKPLHIKDLLATLDGLLFKEKLKQG
ncbi:hypothetical protein BH11ARM1_BH11ARM1_08670 [soil metagenome]